MATVYGVNATIVHAAGPPGSFLKAGKWGGKVRVMTDLYEAASLVAASVIRVAKVPKDSVVLRISNIQMDDLGTTTLTISIGVAASAALFDAATAQVQTMVFFDAIDGAPWVASADTWIILTTAVAAATGTIKSEVYYAVE